jgi:hypothetical protein
MESLRCALRSRLLVAALWMLVAALGGGFAAADAQTSATRLAPPKSEAKPDDTKSGDAKAEGLRPEIAAPVNAADQMVKAGKFQEALVSIRAAEAVAGRTAYENYVIDWIRGVAASGAGDPATAAKSFEGVIASDRLPATDRLKVLEALSVNYFKAGDYPKTIVWTTSYLKEGGADPQLRQVRIRSFYLTNDFANAAKDLREVLDSDEKAGKTPPLDQLQLLASCYTKLGDDAGYLFALEKVLAYYPKKEYWGDAIRRVQTQTSFARSLELDALRLARATGSLTSAAQYTAMAQLALRAGFPAEAKSIVEEGFASGVLGTGADADAQRKLRATVAKQAADDERLLPQNAKDAAAAKEGTPLVTVGFATVTAGQYDKGLALIEEGIAKGGLKQPDEARLHLAIAYLAAGRKPNALEAFKSVKGGDGSADLARLWLIHAQRS